MLEYYFYKPTRMRQLRRGPLAPYLDGMDAELRRKGYQKTTGGQILNYAGQFSRFLTTRGILNAIDHVLNYLRQAGVISNIEQPCIDDPCADIIERYITYLRNIRGLTNSTCDGYTRSVKRFLAFHMERHKHLEFAAIDGPEVLDYITNSAHLCSKSGWCYAVRVFAVACGCWILNAA